jgi:hypothetical protein
VLPSNYLWAYSAETAQNVTKESAFVCERAAAGAGVAAITPGPVTQVQSANAVCNDSIELDGEYILAAEYAYSADYSEYTCNRTMLENYGALLSYTSWDDWTCDGSKLPDDLFWNYSDLTGTANITATEIKVDAPPCPPEPNGTVACMNYAADVHFLQNAEEIYFTNVNSYGCNATDLGFSPLTNIADWTCNESVLPNNWRWYYSAYDGNQTVDSGMLVNCLPAPNATGFNGGTNINYFTNIENASGLILEIEGVGRIYWPGHVNASGADLYHDVFILGGLAGLNTGVLNPTFNSTANITLYNLPYIAKPVIYSDGQPCSDCTFLSYSGSNLTFQVSHFTNYTAGANAQLSIWDENDPEGGIRNRTTGQNVKFYANYTNVTSGAGPYRRSR